ncbi:hypothetical protein EVAR_82094_1 [Eumeta japonica]|uniref:Uncharacterized protein n=1 Tax=Eumeta variegata TaxID=151549 RepID=A0A4C1U1N6_EUMVA|nr:hypothetical protein EVAR_82094_1 [Eumeta japonica]
MHVLLRSRIYDRESRLVDLRTRRLPRSRLPATAAGRIFIYGWTHTAFRRFSLPPVTHEFSPQPVISGPGPQTGGRDRHDAIVLPRAVAGRAFHAREVVRSVGKGRGATTRVALMGALRIPGAKRAHEGRDAGSLHAGGALPETISS